MNITVAYFSATGTTHKIVNQIATSLKGDVRNIDMVHILSGNEIEFSADELLIVGIPVYAGRVPEIATRGIAQLKGHNTPAIAVAVYGNRDYDDALLELSDLLAGNGFLLVSAGAFIARHSIFPKVAQNRPDSADMAIIEQFAVRSMEILDKGLPEVAHLNIKGNRPYRIPGAIPIHPAATFRCKKCGKCVRLCPVGAIDFHNPKLTDTSKCISCGKCIYVCPSQSRKFRGLKYRLASIKFTKAFSRRHEPELFYAE